MEMIENWKNNSDHLHGWLHDEAVVLTSILLESQKQLSLTGVIVEIGVWKGKYFSALLMLQNGRAVYGYDIWLNENISEVKAGISKVGSKNSFELFRVNSRDLNSKSQRPELCEKSIDFISVDGDHSFEGSMSDLLLASNLISPGGVLALDDFLNSSCLGTTESAIAFLQRSDFEPICYITNKLFVTTKGWSEIYRQRIELAISENPTLFGYEISSGTAAYVTSIAGKKLFSFRN
jgi:hypothetical protein